MIPLTYSMERHSHYFLQFSQLFINICINLFILCEIGLYSVAQSGLKFTTILLPQAFKYWEYNREVLHSAFPMILYADIWRMLLNKSKLLKQIQYILKIFYNN